VKATFDVDDSSARGLLALGLQDEDPDQSLLVTAERTGNEDIHLTPGAIVAGRFRITALIGHGGMGDVYHARDLKLGQSVALKFLPSSSGSDPDMIRLFYDEVRVGRQVAHPNVCRIYDLLEVEGRTAIVMEFVEGEDLASLLRRAGQLPYATSLQIARDICAGVEAAHEKRVIHGDLKPANIMIDGRGRARITDFGLSRIAEEHIDGTRIAGTIAYMSPEQFTQGSVSEKADLYSLGMVLYEVFTGTRARQVSGANDPAFAVAPAPPSTVQPAIDRNLERMILRCLAADRDERPSSAHSVWSAFPPGDILDAVMAAGETPPAEFVAESRKVHELRPARAKLLAGAAVAMLIIVVASSQRLTLYGRSLMPLSGPALALRAQAVAEQSSYAGAFVDRASWFTTDLDFRFGSAKELPLIVFHFRAGPMPLLSVRQDHHVGENDPALSPGSVHVVLASDGRLLLLRALLPDSEKLLLGTTVPWTTVLRQAGLENEVAESPAAGWIPPFPFDEKRQWTHDGTSIRASRYRGRLTYFEVFRAPAKNSGWTMRESRVPDVVYFVLILASLIFGTVLARRNIRRRSVDAGAAWRISLWVLVSRALFGLIAGHHPMTAETELAFVTEVAGMALLLAGQVWLGYAAFEPYVRRRWPEALIGWARLVHGRVRDSVVGRDLLLGAIAGLGFRVLDQIRNVWPLFGKGRTLPSHLAVDALVSIRETVGDVFLFQARAIFFAFFGLFVLVLLRIAFKQKGLAATGWLVLAMAAWMRWDDPLVELIVVGLQMAIMLLVLERVGLLAMTAAIYVHLLTVYTPLTADPSAFYIGQSVGALAVVLAIIGYGLYAATFARPASAASAR
jgi:Protein kinase domain